MQEVTVLPFIN